MFAIMETMFTIIGGIIVIVLGGFLCAALFEWYCHYRELKERVEESDDFEKLMRKQLELDAARLKAYEDMLREACRSQAEGEDEYEDEYDEEYDEE